MRRFLIGFSIIALLTVLTAGLLHTPPVRRYVLEYGKNFLREKLQVDLKASSLEYNLFSLSFTLHDVSLNTSQPTAAPPFLAATRISVNLPLVELLRGKFSIEEAALEGVRIHITADAAGNTNLPRSSKEENGPPATIPDIRIDSLEVAGNELVYDDMRYGTVRLPGWHVSMAARGATPEHDIQFRIEPPGTVSYKSRQLPIEHLSVVLKWSGDRLQIVEAALGLGTSRVQIDGEIDHLLDPVFNIRVDAGLQMGEMALFSTGLEDVSGEIRIQSLLRGGIDAPRFSARLLGEALGFRIHKGIDVDAEVVWDPDTGSVSVNPVKIRTPLGNLSGNASIATGSGDSTTHLAFNSLDLKRFSQAIASDFSLSGVADGQIDARWFGLDWKTAVGRADVHILGRGKVSKGIIPIEGRVDLTAQSGHLSAVIRNLNVMGTHADGTLELDRLKNIAGSLQIGIKDLSDAISQSNRFFDRDEAAAPISGGIQLAANLSGTLDDPKIAVVVQGEPLGVGTIDDVSFSANVLYDRSRVQIEQALLTWREQSIRASGEIGLGRVPPELLLEIQGEGIALPRLLDHWADVPPMNGSMDFFGTVSGPVDHPSARLRLKGTELKAFGESWGTLDVSASFRDGRIVVEDLRLRKSGDSDALTAHGFYIPESKEYSFAAQTDLELTRLVVTGDRIVSGRFRADMNGTGNVSNPVAVVAVKISDFTLDSRQLGDFDLHVQIADRMADAELQVPRLGLDAGTRISMQSPYAGIFDVAMDIPDLAVLSIYGPDGEIISGAFQGMMHGFGPLSDWKSLDARLRIEKILAHISGQDIQAEAPVETSLKNGIVHISPSRIQVGAMHLDMAGSLPIESGRSSGEEFRIDVHGSLESLHGYFPELRGFSAKGELQAEARVRGGLDRPDPSLKLSLKNGDIAFPEGPEPFHNVTLEAETRNEEIVLDRFSANWNGAELVASATVPLGFLHEKLKSYPQSDARFSATVLDLNPAVLPGAPEGIGGSVSIRLEGSASGFRLKDLTAKTEFETLHLQIGPLNLEQTDTARISLHEGRVSIDRFELTGSGTQLSLTGGAGLDGAQDIALLINGNSDASLFTSLFENIRATGSTEFGLVVSGTISDPKLAGDFSVRDGRFTVRDFPVQGENVSLSLQLRPGSIEIVEAKGMLNGGQFEVVGDAAYGKDGIGNINLSLKADNVDMNFPEGLRTLSDSRIQVRPRGDQILVDGKITITDGSFRDNLDLTGYFGSGNVQFVEDRNPFLSRLRFNVRLETDRPFVIDNQQAKLMADSELTLVGTFYRPSVTGRLMLEEGGEVYLAEHTYIVDTGIVDFVNESRIEPALNLLARTRTAGYDVNLSIQGSPGRMTTSLTSDPPLPEPDIISLLLTGRTLEEARGSGLNIAREQAISYITGQLGGRFSRAAEQTLGLSRVRIEPNLVSGDSDPGARLTVGQDLRRDLRLIYSMNLVDSSDQILIGEYDLTRRFTLRGTNQYDNSRRFDFQHDLRFGGSRVDKSRRHLEFTIGSIAFKGERIYSDAVLMDKLGVETGKTYDFFRVRKGMERIEKHYRDRDYLEARTQLQQDRGEKEVDIKIDIDAGRTVRFMYEGFNLPGGIRKQVRRIWESGVFDAQRMSDTALEIRRWFIQQRYYEAEVHCTILSSIDDAKEVRIAMQPGIRYEMLRLLFEGAEGIRMHQLEQVVLKEKDGVADSIVYPKKIADLLNQYYRQNGYSAAQVETPKIQLEPETASCLVIFKVDEGPLFHVGTIGFSGNRALTEAELRAVVPMDPGAVFEPRMVRTSIDKLEEIYWSRGFNDVRVESRIERDAVRRETNIIFQFDEQRQGVIGKIEVAGNNFVKDSFILKHLQLTKGDVLDNTKTELSRRGLYKTGSFELVELETDPLAPISADDGESQLPLLLRARVREVVPYKIRYGGFYDTDRGPGAIFDFENRNSLLGGARVLGFRSRYDSDLHEARGYFGQPLHFKFPSVAGATVFVQRELSEASITDRVGFSLQHEMELRENMVLSYGYRFEKAHTSMREPNILLLPDTTIHVAPLTASFTWDTRDTLLDASRGIFLSSALEYAPAFLGSDQHSIKYFGQFFKYVPLSSPSPMPFGHGAKRPRFVYAGGVRIGLSGGFDGHSISESERFFAGGGTTVRGFAQDSIGPVNELGIPSGGEAVFVFNNELRFPIKSIFEGVGFMDIGNVYSRVSDFNPAHVRSAAGPGIRIRTPYFLLRADYGFKLDRKPGESKGNFYFSIGQAF